jgi:ribosomal protein S9
MPSTPALTYSIVKEYAHAAQRNIAVGLCGVRFSLRERLRTTDCLLRDERKE